MSPRARDPANSIRSIVDADTRAPLNRFSLKPELLSNVINKNREKRRYVSYRDLPKVRPDGSERRGVCRVPRFHLNCPSIGHHEEVMDGLVLIEAHRGRAALFEHRGVIRMLCGSHRRYRAVLRTIRAAAKAAAHGGGLPVVFSRRHSAARRD